MDDAERAAFYDVPENRDPVGPGQRREGPTLTSHVPVRFRPETIEEVRVLARADGVTVSTWIRQAVARAIECRR